LAASTIAVIGNYMLRRPTHSTIEVVVLKEEEEEDVMSIEDLWLESPEVQDTSRVNEHALVSAKNNFGLLCCRWFIMACVV
jgi:hypothetical protein